MGWHSGRSNITTDFSGSGTFRAGAGIEIVGGDGLDLSGSLKVGGDLSGSTLQMGKGMTASGSQTAL